MEIPKGNLEYQPEKRAIILKKASPAKSPSPEASTPRIPETVDLIQGAENITESFSALTRKYDVEQFTLATSDGLVFASSGSPNAQTDAAVFSGEFAKNHGIKSPGIVLFGLDFKGSQLVGIVRTKKFQPEGTVGQIIADTKDILNWWI